MSAPFGGHPQLVEYIGWCNQQGCTTTSGFKRREGVLVTYHVITSKDGSYVVVAGISNNERLMPTQVAYLDRRLKLNSPFSKIGDGGSLSDMYPDVATGGED